MYWSGTRKVFSGNMKNFTLGKWKSAVRWSWWSDWGSSEKCLPQSSLGGLSLCVLITTHYCHYHSILTFSSKHWSFCSVLVPQKSKTIHLEIWLVGCGCQKWNARLVSFYLGKANGVSRANTFIPATHCLWKICYTSWRCCSGSLFVQVP